MFHRRGQLRDTTGRYRASETSAARTGMDAERRRVTRSPARPDNAS
jgi:hypothetical protein